MKAENIRFIKEKYGENSPIYRAFEQIYVSHFLTSFVIRYIDKLEENNTKITDLNEKLGNESLVFPKMANALFLTVYSDFEYFLIELCKAYQTSTILRIKLNDLKGEGVIGALDYLDRVVGIDVKNNKYYQELPHWNKIRNYIVHNSAIIDDKCIKSVDYLNIKKASSLDNELICMNFNDVKRFIHITEGIQDYLLKR